MKVYRDQLAKKVMEGLKIADPALSQQFRDRVLKRENEMKERDQISRQLANEREAMARAAAEAATRPAATTKPVMTEEGTIPLNEEVQPPATRSGSNTPDTQPTTSPQKP